MHPRKTLAAAFGLLVFATGAAAGEVEQGAVRPDTDRPAIIRPEDVRPGMKGYALTVFQGTEPERFDIEIVGRLEKALPQQDIILIRCTDEKVRDTKIAAGMSGSPVYVRDAEGTERLVGALAFSWGFQLEAIAGVTPITNMLGDLEALRREGPEARARGAEPFGVIQGAVDYLGAGSPGRSHEPDLAARDVSDAPSSMREWAPGGLRPVATPIMISGLPLECFPRLREQLAPLGLEPVQGGGGQGGGGQGGGGDAGEDARRGFRPGDAIGVQLMRGDSNWTAIGTVTYVDGDHVLAFGHPFIRGGAWEAPVTRANVQLTLASARMSFKLANAGTVVGSLVDDRQACIAVEVGRDATMVPVEVEVAGVGRADRTFRYEIVQHPTLTGMLGFWALADSIFSGYPWRGDATVTVHERIELEGYDPLEVRLVAGGGWLSGWTMGSIMRPFQAALNNPFERVKLERLSFRVKIEPERRSARIMAVRSESQEVSPGEEVTFYVKLRPFGAEDAEVPFTIRVPEEPRRGTFTVAFTSGDRIRPDFPPPRNLAEYLKIIEQHHELTAEDLVATVARPTSGLATEGRVMPSLPASVVNVLAAAAEGEFSGTRDRMRVVKNTRWVLSGSTGISLPLRR